MIIELLKGNISQKELLNQYNANITYAKLDKGINGFVFNYRGIYNIVINSNLSYYKRKKSILHELAHIELSHLDQDNTLLEFHRVGFEDDADRYVEILLKTLKEKVYENK